MNIVKCRYTWLSIQLTFCRALYLKVLYYTHFQIYTFILGVY